MLRGQQMKVESLAYMTASFLEIHGSGQLGSNWRFHFCHGVMVSR